MISLKSSGDIEKHYNGEPAVAQTFQFLAYWFRPRRMSLIYKLKLYSYSLSPLGEGWGEGLSIEPPSYAPLPRPFSQGEKGDIKPTS